MVETEESLGAYIKAQRKRNAWTLDELGAKIGSNKELLSRWEHNKTVPSTKKLKALAKVFKVNIYNLTKYL